MVDVGDLEGIDREPCTTCEGGVYGFRRERPNMFFAQTFCKCPNCGDEHQPGFDHECRRN